MELNHKKVKKSFRFQLIILISIIFITCFLGIGYASFNLIELNIEGTVVAIAQQGIFITDIQYETDTNANIASSKINDYYQAIMNSTVSLSSTDANSSITYNISIYNSTNEEYEFTGVVYAEDELFYDNTDITFELSGLNEGDIITAKQSINFSITFKYKNGVANQVLNSILKFNFEIPTTPVRIAGIKYETDTPLTIDGKTVTIPAGMTLSYVPGEYESPDDGIVIYRIADYTKEQVDSWEQDKWVTEEETMQQTYDQFVWIPVDNPVLDLSSETSLTDDSIKSAVQEQINQNKYPMAIKKSDGNYIGVLYDFTGDANGVTVSPLANWTPTSTSGNREPSSLSNGDYNNFLFKYLDRVNNIIGTNYSNATEFGTALQEQYNQMIDKISANKGFWVGRYETSGMTTESVKLKVNSMKGKMGQTSYLGDIADGVTFVNWHQMYAYQNIYAEQAGLSTMNSNMIWRSQWDQIMIWMKEVPNTTSYAGTTPFYVINSQGMGNYQTGEGGTGELQKTGYYEVKNVYDLAGNVIDWTLKAKGNDVREGRGGGHDGTDSEPYASWRTDDGRGAVGLMVGTRFTIY